MSSLFDIKIRYSIRTEWARDIHGDVDLVPIIDGCYRHNNKVYKFSGDDEHEVDLIFLHEVFGLMFAYGPNAYDFIRLAFNVDEESSYETVLR